MWKDLITLLLNLIRWVIVIASFAPKKSAISQWDKMFKNVFITSFAQCSAPDCLDICNFHYGIWQIITVIVLDVHSHLSPLCSSIIFVWPNSILLLLSYMYWTVLSPLFFHFSIPLSPPHLSSVFLSHPFYFSFLSWFFYPYSQT